VNRIYAGIGSRQTPGEALVAMAAMARWLELSKWRLRSGGANGADTAFEQAVQSSANKAIYLPGPSFNGRVAGRDGCYDATTLPGWHQALATVSQYHPAPDRLSSMARRLMARNAMQILGPNMDQPVDLVICWTPGGALQGGTAQALRIAMDHDITILNLGDEQHVRALDLVIREIEMKRKLTN
jgi:hypothetical protein